MNKLHGMWEICIERSAVDDAGVCTFRAFTFGDMVTTETNDVDWERTFYAEGDSEWEAIAQLADKKIEHEIQMSGQKEG
jgi:hypothetical protein